jgi:hypothetical protein
MIKNKSLQSKFFTCDTTKARSFSVFYKFKRFGRDFYVKNPFLIESIRSMLINWSFKNKNSKLNCYPKAK